MARRIGRSGRFTRGPRRATDWSASSVQTTIDTVVSGGASLLESFTPIVGGETLIRTRGLVTIRSDQVAASEDIIGAFGIGVVTKQAISVGITAIPHPGTDAAWGGWVVHQYYGERFQFFSSVGINGGNNALSHYPVDSKGMRKIDEDEGLVVVFENMAATGCNVTHSFRFLTKVH